MSTLTTIHLTAHPNPSSRVLDKPTATVRHFQKLQELEVTVTLRSPIYEQLLSSVTSIELRKVIILMRWLCDLAGYPSLTEVWASIDKRLCDLVDRLRAMGHRYTLEAELRLIHSLGDLDKHDFTKVLPGFREKGIVTVIL